MKLALHLQKSISFEKQIIPARKEKPMRRYLLACSAAGVIALAAGAAAQDPSATPQTQPQTRTPAAQSQQTATVEGCLMREQDVPGRKPNVAERAGLGEDFILTNAKVVKGSAPATTSQAKPGEPTGTSGTVSAPMYDVKEIDKDRLKQFVGKRVKIEGTFADVEKSPSAAPTEDLVDIRGTTIREASGECPPK
jgi:hypothetical protein